MGATLETTGIIPEPSMAPVWKLVPRANIYLLLVGPYYTTLYMSVTEWQFSILLDVFVRQRGFSRAANRVGTGCGEGLGGDSYMGATLEKAGIIPRDVGAVDVGPSP